MSSGNAVNLQQTELATSEKTTGTQRPKRFTAKSDVESRAAQKKLVNEIKTRPLADRKITAKSLISERGMKVALGKASRNAVLKDKIIRNAYKITHHKSASEGKGSLHKSSIRLAEKYHQLTKNGGSEAERLAVLRELRATVVAMQDKHGVDPEGSQKSDSEALTANLKSMIEFIDHEIASHPTEHLAKAKEMLDRGYDQLKGTSATLGNKLEFMEAVEDHLLAAEEGLGSTDEIKQRLKEAREEITHLKQHQPFRSELEDFVNKKNTQLKHVITRQMDPVADMRAYFKHEEVMGEVQKDSAAEVRHWRMGLDIRTFDRSKLKHVTTQETNDLQRAKGEFIKNSGLDALAELESQPLAKQSSIIKDPALSQLGKDLTGNPKFAGIGSKIATALSSNAKAQDGVAKELGDMINAALSNKSDDIQMGFVTSDGAAFKKELLAQIKVGLGGNTAALFEANGDPKPRLQSMLDTAYTHAVTNLKNAFVDDNNLKLDGITYTKVKDLGAGGYGRVALYEGTKKDGTKDQIAVKVPFAESKGGSDKEKATAKKKVFNDYANEARVLRNASEGQPENVIGFRGAIQTPDGRILIAMDKAPHGDMYALNKNIKAVVDAGKISPQAANLIRATLLRDMLRSLQHLQEKGITHIDLKSPNFFVGEGGVLKMADFGTGAVELDRTFRTSPVDNPIYLAPEMIIQKKELSAEKTQFSTGLREAEARRREEFTKVEDQLTKADRNAMREELSRLKDERTEMVERFEANLPDIEISHAADIWSVGVTAYELFFGELPFNDPKGFMSLIEDQLEAFGKDPNATISLLGKDRNGQVQGTGVTALDRILNQMLHPVPGMRPTAESLLSHSLFDQPGIGEQAVRDLVVLLTDENATADQLKNASDKLGV